ncbi:uncharacterized protein LOC132729544 isoform X2 [Ruditapes philippinarum]|uniref:uncharacterized protein LOC132729544 isoform X2 n=1 Tax=Ruditapes philippinarum TaxID=129788 RepID=UPI00295B7E52|nr:uncharacterized protein LOC132729544 isoform X2 [Ruditapes philippinarum]
MVLQKANTDLFVVFIIVTAYTSVELYVLENKALGKQAFMSSTGGDKVADRAVDGDVSQDSADNSCFLTKNETNAYWEVDLGDKMFIDHVTLYSRKNVNDSLSARRLRDIELYIGPSRNEYTLYGFYEGTLPKDYRLDKGRAGVNALNTDPSPSLSVVQCAVKCCKMYGCYGATFHEDTHMCEYLTSDTGVEADNSLMLIPLG